MTLTNAATAPLLAIKQTVLTELFSNLRALIRPAPETADQNKG